MPTETEIMSKVHAIDKEQATQTERIEGLVKSEGFLWSTIEGFRKELVDMKVSMARNQVLIGIIQVAITAAIVHWLTK